MKLSVEGLSQKIRIAETMAQFDRPISPVTRKFLLEDGLDDCLVIGCMGWVWHQWQLGGPAEVIRGRIESLVDRGMEMQEISPLFHRRPRHDLFLLHCAIFASSDVQLAKLAERVVDATGYKQFIPKNDGELYEGAWCGMIKHWILGDRAKATEQSEIVWKAYRFPNLRASSKPLVTPWLKCEWDLFQKQQRKDFEKLWDRIRKDRWQPIKKETEEETIVDVERFNATQSWCWAHCGMAMLAHRHGAKVATDPFWFPAAALNCVTPLSGAE